MSAVYIKARDFVSFSITVQNGTYSPLFLLLELKKKIGGENTLAAVGCPKCLTAPAGGGHLGPA